MRAGPLLLLVVAAAVASGTTAAAPALVSQSDPHPGIHRELWVDTAIPARIHLVRIDLSSAEIALYATKESDRGGTTSSYSDLIDAQIAINGDAFAVAGYKPRGFAMGDSAPWSSSADDIATAVLHYRRAGERTVAAIEPPDSVVDSATLPPGTQGAIAGRPLLVRAGVVETQFDCNDPITISCSRAPRTAVAISEDGNTMWLAVVNGWQVTSRGLTAAELATFLHARRAYTAIALDGGSSSTLIVDGALANSPSDGIERPVANHLAIKFGALPKGVMKGFICKTADYAACGQNPALQLPGAIVTLDDGRTVTATNAFYTFTGVTPRLACVTVKKAGYKTKVSCKAVQSGVETYNSVFLELGTDTPATSPDPGDDAGAGPGGGASEDRGGAACSVRGGDLGGARSHLLLVALVAWMLIRRAGTKAKG
ncbi:MAG: phosphodiester glycosidase family protein [Deltaproteobacteria bacterium]|nr:phosphodiester glycosidase family protein [Deltaproteobacteria bacterium]MDQ3296712.1 phosphodiester glycosidase family protein [Myxococcota bacterium]